MEDAEGCEWGAEVCVLWCVCGVFVVCLWCVCGVFWVFVFVLEKKVLLSFVNSVRLSMEINFIQPRPRDCSFVQSLHLLKTLFQKL